MNLFAQFFRPKPIAHQKFKACRDGIHGYVIEIFPFGPLYARVEVARLDELTAAELRNEDI